MDHRQPSNLHWLTSLNADPLNRRSPDAESAIRSLTSEFHAAGGGLLFGAFIVEISGTKNVVSHEVLTSQARRSGYSVLERGRREWHGRSAHTAPTLRKTPKIVAKSGNQEILEPFLSKVVQSHHIHCGPWIL